MGVIDAVGWILVLGIIGIFVASLHFNIFWIKRIWLRISSFLDRLRAIHRAIVPVVMIFAVFGLPFVAYFLNAGSLVWLWLLMLPVGAVLFVQSVIRFAQRRYQPRRYRKDLRDGLGLNMSISSTGGNFGFFDRWAGSVSLPQRSILVAGASGSGKTEAAKHFVYQMLFDFSSLMLVYDHKTDFQEFFDMLGVEYIRISMNDSTHVWNLFQEFETEQDIDEFSRALFPEPSGGENDFFDDMARQVFAACLKRLVRKREAGADFKLSNASVRHYFQRNGVDDIYEHLSEYPDFRASASAVDVETSPKQAQGVYSSVQRVVNKVFVGDFGEAPPDEHGFSIREHTRNPQGIPIVLDFPKSTGQSTKPIFRFLIDHTAKLAMQNPDTYSYFVLDEFAQIPHLRQLEELVNVGRSEKVVTLVTLQSVQQLYKNYGRSGGESILAGLVSMVLLRPNDSETADFYREAIGTEFVHHTNYMREKWYGLKRETKKSEEHIFAKGDIRKWDSGVGAVVVPAGWFFGYVPMLNNYLMDTIGDVLSSDEPPDGLPEGETTTEIEDGYENEETPSDENREQSEPPEERMKTD